MTKSNITEYDNTAANNTDVQDVPLGENQMYPSNVNNAFREIMADLADINDGTVAMTSPSATSLSVTNNITVGGTVDGRDVAADGTKLDGIEAGATNVSALTDLSITDGTNGQVLTTNGAGTFTFSTVSASNADTLDGLDSTQFLRSDADDTMTGDLLMDSANAEINIKSGVAGTTGRVNWTFNTTTTNYASLSLPYDTRATKGFHMDVGYPITIDATTQINFDIAGTNKATLNSSGNLALTGTSHTAGGNTIWHNGNDVTSTPNANRNNGYLKFPNGIYLQWGYHDPTATDHYLYFPLAFPSYCHNITGSMTINRHDSYDPHFYSTTRTYVRVESQSNRPYMWFAVGR